MTMMRILLSCAARIAICIVLALANSFTTSTHASAQAKAAPRAAGTIFRDCRACPEMVVLPAGSFTMGSSAEENHPFARY